MGAKTLFGETSTLISGNQFVLVPSDVLQLVHPLIDLGEHGVHPQEPGGLLLQSWQIYQNI
jgi:hypothetical protein